MKKLLFFLNILLLGIIGFMACNSNHNATSTAPCAPLDPCLARFMHSFTSGELRGKIPAILIDTMSGSYAADPGKGFITGTVFNEPEDPHNTAKMAFGQSRDALSTVFDLQKLKLLIWAMNKNSCDNNCDTTIELGIRFYYIKYPPDAGDENGPLSLLGLKNIKNKHALVMVPVYKSKKDKEWYDYDLFGNNRGCYNPIHYSANDDDAVPVVYGIGSDAGDNHGGVSPPPGTGTFPTNEP
jgi:hypothetical protein